MKVTVHWFYDNKNKTYNKKIDYNIKHTMKNGKLYLLENM